MRNLRLDLCYDGTRYRGWQRLSGTDQTIQQKLETALSRLLGEHIKLTGSGRTDSGTHAKLQVANFHCNSTMPTQDILLELRRYLPEDIGVYSCKEASERFHARYNAKDKTYCYRLWASDMPCVFDRRYVYCDPRPLNVEKMREAAVYFLGAHDFSAFCATKNMKKSTVRRIDELMIQEKGPEIRFTVTGDGFLHHMVRIMVSTLMEVGRGEREAASIPELFGTARQNAGPLIPSCGLCLMGVRY